MKTHGVQFTYQLAPRAKIFRRDASKVKDMESMKAIMRYNGEGITIGNRLFYFLIRYKITQQKSKINFPQFLRCMYVCVCVCVCVRALQVTSFVVWSYFFLPRYLSTLMKMQRQSFCSNSEIWGSYAPFSILSKNQFSQ